MDLTRLFLTLGGLFLIGLVTDLVGRRTPLPRVTLLLGFGFVLGPHGLNLLPDPTEAWLPAVSSMALVMVGFLLGGALSRSELHAHGRLILTASLGKALGAFAVVLMGLVLVGVDVETSLLLAAIATATAPAATADVVHEDGAESPFARSLLGVVALDDAWGLVLFGLALASVEAMSGSGGASALVLGARDLGGAVILGLALGLPAAFLTGRINEGEPTQAEALGIVFLCGGLALWLDVSFLLAAMVLGAVVANLAHHHRRPFVAIEGIEWPFMILFFALAGASLDLREVGLAASLIPAYLVLRAGGTMLGAWAGTFLGRDPSVPTSQGGWMGLALMPQAGVAMGMALVASQRLPHLGSTILPVVIATTAIFELGGPILTRLALRRTRSVGHQ